MLWGCHYFIMPVCTEGGGVVVENIYPEIFISC